LEAFKPDFSPSIGHFFIFLLKPLHEECYHRCKYCNLYKYHKNQLEEKMTTFFMMGKYSAEAIKEMSADRTMKSINLISELGGEVNSMHALMGGYDLVLIVSLDSLETAMKASLGLTILTGINFSTFPAVAIEDFDKIMGSSK